MAIQNIKNPIIRRAALIPLSVAITIVLMALSLFWILAGTLNRAMDGCKENTNDVIDFSRHIGEEIIATWKGTPNE